MLKASANARNRCYLHPHRQAERKCERCKTGLCEECDREYRGQHLCQHCLDELEFAEASKPTITDRIREFFTSLRNMVIVLAVIFSVGGAVFYVFRGTLNQPITPEEFARFRYAASGGFQTPEGIDVNSTVIGAKVVSFTSQRPGFEASHLINEYTGPDYPGWRSVDASTPQDIVVEGAEVSGISKVILYQQEKEPRDTWAKSVEVDASTEGPDRGFVKIGSWELAPTAGPQRFTFPVTTSKWLRLRILANYGNPSYTSLDEFDAYVVPQSPLTPTAE